MTFRQVEYDRAADISIRMGRINIDNTLAFTSRRYGQTQIIVNENICWYTDRRLCHLIRENLTTHVGIVILLVIISGIAFLLLRRSPHRENSVTRLLIWMIFLSCQLFVYNIIVPCYFCNDFVVAMMHEIGHVLGFLHANLESRSNVTHLCGCDKEATACHTTPRPEENIMYSYLRNQNHACLGPDDIDGLRTVFGGNCSDSTRCYEATDTIGFARLSIIFVYSLLICCCVAFSCSVLRCAKPTQQQHNNPTRRPRSQQADRLSLSRIQMRMTE